MVRHQNSVQILELQQMVQSSVVIVEQNLWNSMEL